MTSNRFFQAIVLGGALTTSACGAGRPRTETMTAQRLKDSVPEKRAMLRGATPGLDLEAEDDRWGIEAAKERKRASDPRTTNPPPALPVPGAATIDLKTLPNP
jgi:hypothetical protein